MSSSAARIKAHIAAFMLAGAGFAGSASAAIVYSGPVNIPIVDTTDGIYMNVVTGAVGNTPGTAPAGWDINPYSATVGTSFNLWGPTVNTWFNTSGVVTGPYPLTPGTPISGAVTAFFRPGGANNIGPQVTLNSDQNLLGFRFINEAGGGTNHFGWIRVQFGATVATRAIVGYAFESTPDTAINAGDTGLNTAPTITPVGASTTQGSAAAVTTVANVLDAEDAENTLTITVNGGVNSTVNGVTVGGFSTTAAGVVSANVSASCAATDATFTLRVTDSGTLFSEGTLNVQVSPNPAPTLSYAAATAVIGESLVVPAATGPSDNGSIASIDIQDAGTFIGSTSVAGGGGVSLGNAGPIGSHTIVVRATDNCGAITDAPLALTVGQGGTATTITSDTPDPSLAGEAVTVAFTVVAAAPAVGTPTGTVTVSDGVDSCSATVEDGECELTLSTDGARSLTASYAGDSNFAASTSAAEPHTVTPAADLSIAKSVDRSELENGVVGYTIVVANDGPSDVTGATVADAFSAPQSNVEWTCTPNGGTCTAIGAGDINDSVDLPAGASVVYSVLADVPVPLEAPFSNTATVTAPAGVTELDAGNNSATADVQLDPIFADGFEDL